MSKSNDELSYKLAEIARTKLPISIDDNLIMMAERIDDTYLIQFDGFGGVYFDLNNNIIN